MWRRNEQELLSPESRTARTSELNGSGGGRGKGIRGPRSFVPVGNTNRDRTKGPCNLLSRLEPPTGIKGHPFVPIGASNRNKRLMSPPLARLAVGLGTKTTYCPGPKDCRNKWSGTKACSVVVILPNAKKSALGNIQEMVLFV